MKKKLLIKTLALSVIIIFFGVSIQPAFAVKISTINDKTEYIIEIIKEDKKIEKTFFLTEQQVDKLESLIEQIRMELDFSESIDETTKIFYNAVDSFDQFGILPEETSINEIKQFITGESRDLDKNGFKGETGDDFQNRFCMVAGSSTNTYSVGPIILGTIILLIPALYFAAVIEDIIDLLNLSGRISGKILLLLREIFIAKPVEFLLYLSVMSLACKQPGSIGSFLSFGVTQESTDPWTEPVHKPADGWIKTIGLNGYKNYSGKFYGQLNKIWGLFISFYSGIAGFTGINIRNDDSSEVFYLGFGLKANIARSRPK